MRRIARSPGNPTGNPSFPYWGMGKEGIPARGLEAFLLVTFVFKNIFKPGGVRFEFCLIVLQRLLV